MLLVMSSHIPKAAQIKNTAEGIYDQVAGRVQNVKAAVTGDKSGQVDAVAQVS